MYLSKCTVKQQLNVVLILILKNIHPLHHTSCVFDYPPTCQGFYFHNTCSYEGRSPLGRPKRSLADNAKMGVKETGWENWTGFVCFRKGLFRSPLIRLFYLTIWSLRLWVTTVDVPIVFYFDQLSVY